MIEVEVHHLLLKFLRGQETSTWPHHLTMARLVARALRLGRSALIQTGYPPHSRSRYQLSYLLPVLVWSGPVVIVVPVDLQEQLSEEIFRLREVLKLSDLPATDTVRVGNAWPNGFEGLLLTTPESWLQDRCRDQGQFPAGIPTIWDSADNLEEWSREQLTATLVPAHWTNLIETHPEIQRVQDQLKALLFQHPVNPYQCCLIDPPEQAILDPLLTSLGETLPAPWQRFWEQWQQPHRLQWATLNYTQQTFTLHCGPVEIATALSSVWSQQPIVVVGGVLDLETQAPIYRQTLGLGELTCVKFSPDRQNDLIQVYLPDRIPLPNTPQFAEGLIQEVRTLLYMRASIPGFTVVLVSDIPLKGKVGAILASELGSRVQVENPIMGEDGILVTGWEFWQHHQETLPAPHLLIIATLPLPSLEDPRVAGRVAYYKQRHINWFNQYLLPTALNILQRAVAPVRECQGVVALLDSRVIHRSYGPQVLAALSPHARIDYLDTLWLAH